MEYNPQKLEKRVLKYWETNKTHQKLKRKRTKGKRFFYLDGPPYVTGSPHPGLGWNRTYKDIMRRYYWKRGFNVWDQPGFDCHGLPIETGVEKKLGLRNREDIIKYGANKFIQECKKEALKNHEFMTSIFARIGEWADWKKPYLTLDDNYIESVWWAISEAWKKGLVYEGLKALTWCPRCGTALAGNYEVVHKTLKDNSIFIKFPVKGRDKEFLLVWTTTPWTIPFNMAVMVHPDLEYLRIRVDDEIWIIAKGLAGAIMGVLEKPLEVLEELKGAELEGLEYWHPFYTEIPKFKDIKSEWMHKVVLSEEYVNLSAGTGLVHCAPGCGPEDFEIGLRYKIFPFNNLDENGVFRDMGEFDGMVAKRDDNKFVEMLKSKGLVVREAEIEHEYPTCERCETPVIFKTTKQWFLNVTKVREKMLSESKKVKWVPNWAGANQFANWLENIKDWCLTRQRFWGAPFPVWKCEKCGEVKFVSSRKELKKQLKELHKPYIDEVTFKCKCGGTMNRTPDVVDVWIDASCVPFASLGYPSNKKTFRELFPADLIIEAKDQIRGWFYGLIAMSVLLFGKGPFKRVYMHGWLNDEQGIGMSKRLGNYVELHKIIEKFGADVFRLSMIKNTSPGLDVRYDEKTLSDGYRTLNVLWNIHIMLLKTAKMLRYKPKKPELDNFEDRWVASKVNSLVEDVTSDMEKLEINEMQYVLERVTNILSPVVPFITEEIYRSITKEESVHLKDWPSPENIDKNLEIEMDAVKKVVQAGLYLRDSSKIGIRWPLRKLMVKTTKKAEIANHEDLIKEQLNVKGIEFIDKHLVDFDFKFNYENLKRYGPDSARIISKLMGSDGKNIKEKSEEGFSVDIDGKEFMLGINDFIFEPKLPENLRMTENPVGSFYIDIEADKELEEEGYVRELIRRIQEERKAHNLERPDFIVVRIGTDPSMQKTLERSRKEIEEKTNSRLEFGKGEKGFSIRNKKFTLSILVSKE
jgi:isoleucyl-tRNA synthetase